MMSGKMIYFHKIHYFSSEQPNALTFINDNLRKELENKVASHPTLSDAYRLKNTGVRGGVKSVSRGNNREHRTPRARRNSRPGRAFQGLEGLPRRTIPRNSPGKSARHETSARSVGR